MWLCTEMVILGRASDKLQYRRKTVGAVLLERSHGPLGLNTVRMCKIANGP